MTALSVARRLVRAAVALALVAIVAIFVVMAVPGVIGAEHSYVVLTNSMEPDISPGDAVVVDEVDPADVAENDVITFRREADRPPVTHRVVSVIRDGGEVRFRTAGDNNEDVDPWTVGSDALVGRVWFTLPLIGHVVRFGNSTAGAAVLVGLPIAALVLSELWARSGETTVTRVDSTPTADESTEKVLPRFEEGSSAANQGGDVRLSLAELRLGALGFTTFAIYAIYVAAGTTSGVTVGVAVGATIAALFHLGGLATVQLAGRSGDEPSAETAVTGNRTNGHGGADD